MYTQGIPKHAGPYNAVTSYRKSTLWEAINTSHL